jgi:molybdopterin-synthase adenylyltransferase
MTSEEKQERYLTAGDTSAPGVGPFTGVAADFAVATLFDLVKPFRRFPGELRRDMFCVDFVTMHLSSVEQTPNSECPYCGTRSMVSAPESYRLNRPALGKRVSLD